MDLHERRVDNSIHALGLALCLPGLAVLIVRTGTSGKMPAVTAAATSAIGMLTMFGFSAAYHFNLTSAYSQKLTSG